MNSFDLLKLTFNNLNQKKGRTFLTILGIIIGIFTFTFFVFISQGLDNAISEQFNSLGYNVLSIQKEETLSGFPQGEGITEKNVYDVKKVVRETKYIVPGILGYYYWEHDKEKKNIYTIAFNIIRYPTNDINECFKTQVTKKNMDNPYLFLTAPTQHIKGIAPDKNEQLIIVTSCEFDYFSKFKSKENYNKEKDRIANEILDIIEREYVPNLREHIDVMVVGSPTTNERFVNTINGNCYGMELTPENIKVEKVKYNSTNFKNLYLIGAIPGIPSFGGGLHTSMLLADILTKKK